MSPAVSHRSPSRNSGSSLGRSRSQARSRTRALICGQHVGPLPGFNRPGPGDSGPRRRDRLGPDRLDQTGYGKRDGRGRRLDLGTRLHARPLGFRDRIVSSPVAVVDVFPHAVGQLRVRLVSFAWITARIALTRPTPTSVTTSYSPVMFAISLPTPPRCPRTRPRTRSARGLPSPRNETAVCGVDGEIRREQVRHRAAERRHTAFSNRPCCRARSTLRPLGWRCRTRTPLTWVTPSIPAVGAVTTCDPSSPSGRIRRT